jgi:hypothetical protein
MNPEGIYNEYWQGELRNFFRRNPDLRRVMDHLAQLKITPESQADYSARVGYAVEVITLPRNVTPQNAIKVFPRNGKLIPRVTVTPLENCIGDIFLDLFYDDDKEQTITGVAHFGVMEDDDAFTLTRYLVDNNIEAVVNARPEPHIDVGERFVGHPKLGHYEDYVQSSETWYYGTPVRRKR